MTPETINFINRIKHYELKRNLEEDENTFIKRYHKSRLNSCYNYLKFLSTNNTGIKLKEDYIEVMNLSKECEQEFIKWQKNHEKNT